MSPRLSAAIVPRLVLAAAVLGREQEARSAGYRFLDVGSQAGATVPGDSPDLGSAQLKCGGCLVELNYGEVEGIAKQLTGPLGAPFGASSNTLPETDDH